MPPVPYAEATAGEPPGSAGLDPPDIPEIDTSVPHPARVYTYFLGGTDYFEADRIAAEAAIKTFPRTAELARAARAFLRRVVRYLAAGRSTSGSLMRCWYFATTPR